MTDSDETEIQGKKDRSPSYPFISLSKAIDRARALADHHKRAPARLVAVAPTWGYGVKSSGLLQTVAALKQYGLIDDFGSGEERKIVLSDLAWKILLDSRPGAKEQAIREAATKPRLIAEYLEHWVPERPSDAHCISELHLDRGFTQEAAKTFLKVFDETVEFASLKKHDSLSGILSDKTEENPRVTVADASSKVKAGATAGFSAEQPLTAGSSRATFPLPEGTAALELPATLSPESYEDLKAWLDVMLRLALRSVPKDERPSGETETK